MAGSRHDHAWGFFLGTTITLALLLCFAIGRTL